MSITTDSPPIDLNSFLASLSDAVDGINTTECGGRTREDGLSLFIIWSVSLTIAGVLIIAQKRTYFHPDRCYGRPGLPIPLDFLVSPRNRFTFTILFAIMGTGLINGYGNFSSVLTLETTNIYSILFNKILWSPFCTVMSLVLEYFPLFATVEFSIPWFGYIIGWCYSLVWFGTLWGPRFSDYNYFVKTCTVTNFRARSEVAVTILRDLPLIIMCCYIVLWFTYQMIFFCIWKPCHKKKVFSLENIEDYGIRKYHLQRVRSLLEKPAPSLEDKFAYKVWRVFFGMLKYFFPFQRNYKMPMPLLGAIVAMVMIIYQISLTLIAQTFILLSQLEPVYSQGIKPLFDQLEDQVPEGGYRILITATQDTLASLLVGIPAIVATAPFLSVILCIFLLIHLVSSISKDIKNASRRGFEGRLPNRVRRVSDFWKYIGIQIGLFITAWIVYTAIFSVVGLAILIFYFILKYPNTRNWFFTLALGALIPLVWTKLLFTAQRLICKYFFVEDKGKGESKFIPIKHRRLYNWFAFVLFFYNGFAGVIGGIVRIIISALFGTLLIFRLDVLALPQQFWWWDFGHKSYLSFIYLDYCYNNPVVHVFIHLLESITRIKEDRYIDVGKVELVGADELMKNNPRGRLIRNRWLVAYTLVRNPSIQQYTAKNLQLLKEEGQKKRVFLLAHTIHAVQEERKLVEEVSFGDDVVKQLEEAVTPADGTNGVEELGSKFAGRAGGKEETGGSETK